MKDSCKRTNYIYGNWTVLHPDGFEMFKCVDRKANWYLNRNLAYIVSLTPKVIKLTFKPNGVGWKDDKFALSPKKNICVVCGESELSKLTTHHIVPTFYKKHFPEQNKIATSHDVIVICRKCHDEYENVYALQLKEKISNYYGVPLCNSKSDFSRIIQLSKTLYFNYDLIPIERKEQLTNRIINLIGISKSDFSIEHLESFAKISKKQYNDFHNNHGKFVVEKIENIQDFVVMWRQDFVNKMMPKFMPEYWDINRPFCRNF